MAEHATKLVVTPEAVARWRSTVTCPCGPQTGKTADPRGWVTGLEESLHQLANRLHEKYGTPHLGNMAHPTDEFAYIVLSRKTPERAYVASFRALKDLGPWALVQNLDPEIIEDAIRGGGLERKKTTAIIDGLSAIRQRFGAPDLSRAADLNDGHLFEFIVSLPEVGPKSALCIMLYSFQRAVFPVDAHVGRILARSGVFDVVGLDLSSMGHKERQRQLRHLVPPDLRYELHVNLVSHGRSTCKAAGPDCTHCVIVDLCAWASSSSGSNSHQEAS